MLPFLLTVLFGTLLGLSFYCKYLFWISLIAFLPLLVNGNFKNFTVFGLAFSLTAFLPLYPALNLVSDSWLISISAFLITVFLFFLYQFGLTFLINNPVRFLPLSYLLVELSRNYIPFGGFPLFSIGHIAGNFPFLNFSLYYLPVEVWSFLILLINWLIFKTFENWESEGRKYLALIVLTLLITAGLAFLSPSRVSNSNYRLTVAVINPKIPQKDKLENQQFLKPYLVNLIVRVPKNVELILLPETYLTEEDNVADFVKTFPERNLIFGAIRLKFNFKELQLFAENTVVFSERGKIKGIYIKRKLVPFGEYTPKGFSFLSKKIPYLGRIDYKPGSYSFIFNYKGLKIYPLICWEVFFQPAIPKMVNIAIVLTNNAWFNESFTNYHLLVSKIEAIKENKVLVLVNNGAFGAVVYPNAKEILLRKRINIVEL